MSEDLRYHDKESIEHITNYIKWMLTPLSLLGSTIMFISCLRIRPMTITIKFIATLAFSDILFSATGVMSFFNYEKTSSACYAEAVINSFFFNFSTYIASAIAVLHYKLANINKKCDHTRFFRIVLLVGILFCSFCSFGVFVTDSIEIFQEIEGSCFQTYFGTDSFKRILYFMYADAPIYTGIIVSIVFYYLAKKRIRHITLVLLKRDDVEMFALILYPLVLFLTLSPFILLTFLAFFIEGTPAKVWVVINFISVRSIGFFNAVTYGIQRNIYRSMLKKHDDVMLSGGHRSCSMVLITDGKP